ncbi:hypothetical protein [Streptomyces exfoliatus]|uniref:hypothetical protein n=1 Tax=Streptomyces exfoliatus TaxID=1905 RepID=UPI003C2BFB46
MRSKLERSLIVLPALTVVMAAAMTSAAAAAPLSDRSSVAGEAGTSVGDPAPTACDNPVRTWYEIAGSSPAIHMKWPGTSFKDGPGGTMVVKVETGGKLKIEGTAGFETEVSGVVAAAKAKVDVTLGVEVSITVGHEYRHDISRNKYGHTVYGAWGRKVTWRKYTTSADRCGKRLVRTATFTIPGKEGVGWRYWETSS